MSADTQKSFYRAALIGLLAQEQASPTNRRFGAEADAAWSIFQGHLDTADRIDLLLRDAAVKHPAAFAPRTVFSGDPDLLPDYTPSGLPEDEPFGPSWHNPFGADTGRQLWKHTLEAQGSPTEALWERILETWSVTAEPPHDSQKPDTTTLLLVVGAQAIAGLAAHFLADPNLDWGRQVQAVASTPAGLQLAGLVPLLVGSPTPSRVIGLQGNPDLEVTELGPSQPDRALTSASPTPLEAAFLQRLGSPA
jgi:hypothetical protein